MKARILPPLADIKAAFRYNPVTGEFQRKKKKSGWRPMHQRATGRRSIYYKGQGYPASRIAYYMMTGEDPGDLYVDHINGDGTDNRWGNLRAVTPSENSINRKTHAKSGHKGIYLRPRKSGPPAYVVQVCRKTGRGPVGEKYSRDGFKRKTHTLGIFDTLEEAKECYIKWVWDNGLQGFSRPENLTPIAPEAKAAK
jgi:hypothetical protein